MAGRFTVEAVFKAVDKMSAPIVAMTKKVDTFIAKTDKSFGKVTKFNDMVSGNLKRAGAITAGAAIATAAIVREIVQTGAEFDKTLVAAAAKFDPAIKRGTEGFEALRAKAEEIGEKTEFNAQQAAEGLRDLAGAGFTTTQAMAALPAIVDLATASEVGLGEASNMATKALGAFGLKTEDATQLAKNLTDVTNVMAIAAGKTEASMGGLFESIQEGAPVAVAAGVDMKTFMAMTATMAGAGIEASKAGTTMKDMILALAAPTKKASAQLQKLGITVKDKVTGNLRDPIAVMGEFEEKLAGMGTADKTRALERIFGRIPIAGISAMLEKGAASMYGLRGEFARTDITAAKMAETMRDTVTGDLDEFTSAIDGVKIALFSTNNQAIRDGIKAMTEWVRDMKPEVVRQVGDSVRWLGENLGSIVTAMKWIAGSVAAWYLWATAIKTVQMAITTYNAAIVLGTAAMKLFKWSLSPYKKETVIQQATGQLELFATEAQTASGAKGLAGLREGLNASKLGQMINGVKSKLGAAGLLGAAALVGYEFGGWLNDTFKLDEKISDLVGKVTGLNDKLKNRNGGPGLDPKGDRVFADGSVQRADGTWKKKTAARIASEKTKAAEATANFGRTNITSAMPLPTKFADKFAPAPVTFGPGEVPQVVSPQERTARTIEETTKIEKTELTIKDETGKAQLTKKPQGRNTTIKLQQSGGL